MVRRLIQHLVFIAEKVVIRFFNFIQAIVWRCKKPTRLTNTNLLNLGTIAQEYQPDQRESVYLSVPFRLRHMYLLGATGTGKTNLLESFLRQDIQNQRGFCLLDCHGDLSNSLISYIASLGGNERVKESLAENTILIEPFNKEWVIGFNPLKVTNEESLYPKAIDILTIFQKIWGKDVFGSRTSELFRNTLVTLMANNLTLLEASELLTNDYFRNSLIDQITIPEVKNYWLHRYNPLSEKMKVVYREAVINKLTVFTSDPQIRLMLGAGESGFDFEQAINDGKWIILNLAKGYLKENMNLMATLFISHLANCALQRINLPSEQRNPFFLYIDEFQNFCHSGDLITLLSEARKYAVGALLCHQHSKQLDGDMLKAILGNTQTQIYFRLSYQDSLFFASELNPRQKDKIAKTLIDLSIGQAYLKIKGTPPCLLSTRLCPEINISKREVNEFRELVFRTHGCSFEQVMNEIEERTLTPDFGLPESEDQAVLGLTDQELEEGQDEW